MSILSRRLFLGAATAGILAVAPPRPRKASICLTFDLEMSRNFPTWDQTHWDYEKGNLDEAARKYTVEAARRIRRHGGVLHCFALGRTFEQGDAAWLKNLVVAGHLVGNHTYDHVNVRAQRLEDIQYRFNRAPWLIEGKTPTEVIRDNIRLTSVAIKTRLGVDCAGFRTPGGFADGLSDRPDLRDMLRDLGFWWASCKYPTHLMGKPGEKPSEAVLASIVAAQKQAQPWVYPGGLIEMPMSAPSDIVAFRGGKWKLEWFLEAVGRAVDQAIESGGVYDFLAHPSCLGVVDPRFRTIEMICERVRKAGDRAELTDLETIARRYRS
ncbi:MAG: polysaccharide deacetylase family protein [Gemmataceae bacterium]